MPSEEIRLILTCVGSPMAWEMVRSYSQAASLNIRVIGVDMNPQAIGRYFADRFYPVPSGKSPEYAEALLDICEKEGADLVIPGSDEEAFNLSRNNGLFKEKGIVCTVPREDLIEAMSDKFMMYETLKTAGIPVPGYQRVHSIEDLERAGEVLGYPGRPFVLKLSSNRGGRGVWKICEGARDDLFFGRSDQVQEMTLEEMIGELKQRGDFPPMIAMSHLEGEFYDVDVLSKEGSSYFKVIRRRLNPLGIPFRGNVFEKNDEISSLVERVQSALGLTYLYDIDVVYNPGEGPQLMEVNPRPSGSAVATVHAGLNLFEFLVRMALGLEVPRVEAPHGMTVLPKTSLFIP